MQLASTLPNEIEIGAINVRKMRMNDNRNARDVIVQAIAATKVHLQIRQGLDAIDRAPELCWISRERIDAKIVIDDETQPEAQLANLNRLLLNVDAIKTVLNDFLFDALQPLRSFLTHRIDVAAGCCFDQPTQVKKLV